MTSNEIIDVYRNSIGCLHDRAGGRIHVAIVDSHTARLILAGKKSIETRFSVFRHVPYGKIREGDTILFKKSGGPVVGIAQAERVRFYSDLNVQKVDVLKAAFNDLIQANHEFWKQKRGAKYATFIYLHNVKEVEPFWISKKDRNGWRIYESPSQIEILAQPNNGRSSVANGKSVECI